MGKCCLFLQALTNETTGHGNAPLCRDFPRSPAQLQKSEARDRRQKLAPGLAYCLSSQEQQSETCQPGP